MFILSFFLFKGMTSPAKVSPDFFNQHTGRSRSKRAVSMPETLLHPQLRRQQSKEYRITSPHVYGQTPYGYRVSKNVIATWSEQFAEEQQSRIMRLRSCDEKHIQKVFEKRQCMENDLTLLDRHIKFIYNRIAYFAREEYKFFYLRNSSQSNERSSDDDDDI